MVVAPNERCASDIERAIEDHLERPTGRCLVYSEDGAGSGDDAVIDR